MYRLVWGEKHIETESNIHISSLFLLFLCAFFAFKDILGISLPNFIVYLFLIVISPTFTRFDMAVVGSCMPLFLNGINHAYIFLILLVVYHLKYFNSIKVSLTHLGFIILLLIELTHVNLGYFEYSQYFVYAVDFLFLSVMLTDRDEIDNRNIDHLFKVYVVTYLYVMLDIFIQTLKHVSLATIVRSRSFRFGNLMIFMRKNTVLKTLYDNENMIAMFSLFAIMFCVFLLLHYGFRLFYCLAAVVAIYVGFSTLSKTFMISIMLALLLVSASLAAKRNIQSKKKIYLFVFGGAGAIIIGNTMLYNVIIKTYARFFGRRGFTTGRAGLFKEYLEYFMLHKKYWLSGIGLQNIIAKTGIWNSTHNGFEEVLICFGIVGILVFLIIFSDIFKRARFIRGEKMHLEQMSLVLLYVFFTQSIQFIRVPGIYLCLIMIFYTLCYSNEDRGTLYSCKENL